MRERYGNLFDMYHKITGENAYKVPMRIFPAVHYTMGGLWVDYNLMSNLPGLLRAGRGEFLRSRREPPRRQRADAGPGGRLFRPAVHDRQLSRARKPATRSTPDHPEFKKAEEDVPRPHAAGCSASTASAPSIHFHRELGLMHVGQMRHGPQRSRPEGGARSRIPALREEFWKNVNVLGRERGVEPDRSKRPAAWPTSWSSANCCACDALDRRESCGGHFREEYQTADGEAKRDDENFAYVAAWEYAGDGQPAASAQGTAGIRRRAPAHPELQMIASDQPSEFHSARLAAEGRRRRQGRFVEYEATRHSRRHVVPGNAGRRQRRPDRRRRGADRVRSRLPRRHLRHVLAGDQRHRRTAPIARRRPASFTCGISRTARPSSSSRSAPAPFPCSRT